MAKKTQFKNHVLKPVFSDARGDIFDIVEGKVGHVGLVTFKAGVVRANHYHKKSTQYSYVLDGTIELVVSDTKGRNKKKFTLKKGSFNVLPPKLVHIYTALTPATMLDVTTMSRDDNGYEEDTVRMPAIK